MHGERARCAGEGQQIPAENQMSGHRKGRYTSNAKIPSGKQRGVVVETEKMKNEK